VRHRTNFPKTIQGLKRKSGIAEGFELSVVQDFICVRTEEWQAGLCSAYRTKVGSFVATFTCISPRLASGLVRACAFPVTMNRLPRKMDATRQIVAILSTQVIIA